MCGGGWGEPFAWIEGRIHARRVKSTQGFMVLRIELAKMVFGHAAAVLLLQGMPLQDFFPPDVALQYDNGRLYATGPFILLKGELSKPWETPCQLREAVFAAVSQVPDGLSREEVLGLLLKEVL